MMWVNVEVLIVIVYIMFSNYHYFMQWCVFFLFCCFMIFNPTKSDISTYPILSYTDYDSPDPSLVLYDSTYPHPLIHRLWLPWSITWPIWLHLSPSSHTQTMSPLVHHLTYTTPPIPKYSECDSTSFFCE